MITRRAGRTTDRRHVAAGAIGQLCEAAAHGVCHAVCVGGRHYRQHGCADHLAVVGWVLVAFTAARFAAMGFNRIVDRDVDAVNPRTANRELPRGALTRHAGQGVGAWSRRCCLCLRRGSSTHCARVLSPIALLWVLGYSYTKRFTRWSHMWLGLGLSIAPVGGYLAVTGAWSNPWWLLCALALVVVTWSSGFDILYALQDADFDRDNGLYSIPSAIGVRRP